MKMKIYVSDVTCYKDDDDTRPQAYRITLKAVSEAEACDTVHTILLQRQNGKIHQDLTRLNAYPGFSQRGRVDRLS
jgi:hypothetical protein